MIIIVVHMTWSYHQAMPLHRANVPRKVLFTIFVCYANAFISKKSKKEEEAATTTCFLIELGNSMMKETYSLKCAWIKWTLGEREREKDDTLSSNVICFKIQVYGRWREKNNERTQICAFHANNSVFPRFDSFFFVWSFHEIQFKP